MKSAMSNCSGERRGATILRMSTPLTDDAKRAFINTLMTATDAARVGTSVKTKLLVTAHGAYESGWGRLLAAQGFNYWNLSAGPYWKGPVVMAPDTEYTPGSTEAKAITQHFRSYASAVAGVQDYFSFVSTPRYRDGLARLLNGDQDFIVDWGTTTYGHDGKSVVNAWPAGITKGGFYTLPIPRYRAEFLAVLSVVESLAAVSA